MDYDFKQAVKYLFENDRDIEDALKELVIEAIENDYWVEDAIEDIIEDCRVDSIQTINC